jgi:hypothetical protein
LNLPSDDADVARANAVVDRMAAALEGCPTKTYFVVRQHGVSAADFSDARRSMPRLASHLSGESDYVKSTLVVPDVIEENFTAAGISKYLQSHCGAQVLSEDATAPDSDKQRVVEVTFAAPLADKQFRSAQLEQKGKHMRRNFTRLTLTMLRWRAPGAHLETRPIRGLHRHLYLYPPDQVPVGAPTIRDGELLWRRSADGAEA